MYFVTDEQWSYPNNEITIDTLKAIKLDTVLVIVITCNNSPELLLAGPQNSSSLAGLKKNEHLQLSKSARISVSWQNLKQIIL